MAYTTNTGSGFSEAQGVQQPYEITVITSIKNGTKLALEFSTYPNPTTDVLTLKVENVNEENLSYQLFDLNGNLLVVQNIKDNQTAIFMSNLAAVGK